MAIKQYQNFNGGLNLNQSTNIADNELTIAKNVFYNNSKQIQSRRWFTTFWNSVGSDPFTSFFFFQRDDTLERIAVAHAWSTMYKYDGSTWNSVKSGLIGNETIPGITENRVRVDYAVYKNIIYMMDGVNPYAKYDWTDYTAIGIETAVVCTFDNTTEYVNKTTHWLVANDEVFFTTDTALPAEITVNQVYYVILVDADNFQITTSPSGTALDFTDNWSGTNEFTKLSEPRCRYIAYLNNTMFGASDDANPTTLYWTDTLSATSNNINQNVLVVWGDEQGRINAISEYSNTIIAFKDSKVYWVDISVPSSQPIDTQTWGFSNRSVNNVGNSLVYFNERWVDTLQRRSGVDGYQAIESEELSTNVRALMQKIQEKNYNASASIYIKKHNNYYFSFDTTGDDIPDTTLVYNSVLSSRTQYVLPSLYDYWTYINADKEVQNIFTSGSWGQVYQFETGFDDDWQPIESEIQTKDRDFDDPAQLKMFEWVDVTGYKQEWWEIDIKVIIEWEVRQLGKVTDSRVNLDVASGVLWVDWLGTQSLWVWEWDDAEWLPLYKFTVKLPVMIRWSDIAVNMSATWVQWILEKIRVWVNNETVQIFGYNNII